MPSLDPEKPGIATKGVYDSAFLHSGGCRLFIMEKSIDEQVMGDPAGAKSA